MKKHWLPLAVCVTLSSQVVAKEAPQLAATSQTLVSSTTSWEGSPLPAVMITDPEVKVLKITIPPKTRLPLHYHPVINAGYLVKGQLTVVRASDRKTLELKAGDALVEMVNNLHYGENKGDTPAEIVVMYVGNKGERHHCY